MNAMRVLALLFCLVLGVTSAQTRHPVPESAAPIGQYLRGTFSGHYDEREVVITLDSGDVVNATTYGDGPRYRVGQRVIVWKTGGAYLLYDPIRYPVLAWLLALFVTVTALVGRAKGLRAVLGTLVSLAVLLFFVTPRLLAGAPVVPTTLAAVVGVLAASVYLVHGIRRKTTAALVGTLLSATAGLALTIGFANWMRLSGVGGAGNAVAQASFGVDPLGLYLVSVIIGALGALNDVTVTQASVVETLSRAHPNLGRGALYARAMRVGRDHIGSMVNVLVLAYAAGSIPLLLLLYRDPTPVWVQVNGEGFASEIAGLLIGVTCLLLAVPVTTWISAAWTAPRSARHHDPNEE